jgi:nitroreductase
LNRFSSRAFSEQEIHDEELMAILEAATWAPSANNEQPWRFFIARTKEERALFISFLNPRNKLWAHKAPVLILLGSAIERANKDLNSYHCFDAGAAWGYLALQASILGLSTRAMGGFDKEKAKHILNIPIEIVPHVVVALGYPGNFASFP